MVIPAPGNSLSRLRSLPRAPAPNADPTSVKTNLPEADVILNQNILAFHIAHHPGSAVFGNTQSGHLKLAEVYVRRRGSAEPYPPAETLQTAKPADLEGVTVCELTVTKGAQPVPVHRSSLTRTLMHDVSNSRPGADILNIPPTRAGRSRHAQRLRHVLGTVRSAHDRLVSPTGVSRPATGKVRAVLTTESWNNSR